jgi:hypothetical protein
VRGRLTSGLMANRRKGTFVRPYRFRVHAPCRIENTEKFAHCAKLFKRLEEGSTRRFRRGYV